MVMNTLVSILLEVSRHVGLAGREFMSLAHGPVVFKEIKDSRIYVTQNEDTYSFDDCGRLYPKGHTLLFPSPTETNWNAWKQEVINEYYNSLLRSGDICLAKKTLNDPWVLAVYSGPWEGGMLARVSTGNEKFEKCITYKSNEELLGRVSFPDWMIQEEEG